MSLTVKVRLPPGLADGEKAYKLKSSYTVQKAVKKIVAEFNAPPQLYSLYIPGEGKNEGEWLSPKSTLNDAKVTAKVLCF
jgi:hypothetical protein